MKGIWRVYGVKPLNQQKVQDLLPLEHIMLRMLRRGRQFPVLDDEDSDFSWVGFPVHFPRLAFTKKYRITCCNWESTHEFPANSLRHFMWHLRWTEGLLDPFPMNNPRPSDNLSSKIGCKPGQIMVSWYHGPVRIRWTCNSNMYLDWSSHGWKIHRWVYNEAMIYIYNGWYIYILQNLYINAINHLVIKVEFIMADFLGENNLDDGYVGDFPAMFDDTRGLQYCK